jgi:hypothetical protein
MALRRSGVSNKRSTSLKWALYHSLRRATSEIFAMSLKLRGALPVVEGTAASRLSTHVV